MQVGETGMEGIELVKHRVVSNRSLSQTRFNLTLELSWATFVARS